MPPMQVLRQNLRNAMDGTSVEPITQLGMGSDDMIEVLPRITRDRRDLSILARW